MHLTLALNIVDRGRDGRGVVLFVQRRHGEIKRVVKRPSLVDLEPPLESGCPKLVDGVGRGRVIARFLSLAVTSFELASSESAREEGLLVCTEPSSGTQLREMSAVQVSHARGGNGHRSCC